jgi:hypothetical protein
LLLLLVHLLPLLLPRCRHRCLRPPAARMSHLQVDSPRVGVQRGVVAV